MFFAGQCCLDRPSVRLNFNIEIASDFAITIRSKASIHVGGFHVYLG